MIQDRGAARWGDDWGGVLFAMPGGLQVWLAGAVDADGARAALAAEFGGEPSAWVAGEAETRADWLRLFRASFRPIEAGGMRIVPPWMAEGTPAADEPLIVINPTLAFGTGQHDTTRLMLEEMGADGGAVVRGRRVLDIGAGSAILAIAAAKWGAARPIGATEIDPESEPNARENILASGIAPEAIDYRVTGILEGWGEQAFDLLLCNMLIERFRPLLPALAMLAAPGARLILSGFLHAEEAAAREALALAGWDTPGASRAKGEWGLLIATRREG
jgi:ribosomal protein L11 methyltransferase